MPMLHDLDFDDWRVLICDDLAAREHSFRLSSERTSPHTKLARSHVRSQSSRLKRRHSRHSCERRLKAASPAFPSVFLYSGDWQSNQSIQVPTELRNPVTSEVKTVSSRI